MFLLPEGDQPFDVSRAGTVGVQAGSIHSRHKFIGIGNPESCGKVSCSLCIEWQ
ncbi:MAG TPA: hypothetical protein PLQ12_11370 [Candidatus Defluviicoccus seviourii]|nr:hypothetical protein [Candidatus Defluviicoccus seviourii]